MFWSLENKQCFQSFFEDGKLEKFTLKIVNFLYPPNEFL